MPEVYCSPDCARIGAVCDFCIHFNFNGNADGAYTGAGYCKLHERDADPGGGCSDFHCTAAKQSTTLEQESR